MCAEGGGMRHGPVRRVQAVIDAGGEFVLGRQSIVDRCHDARSARAQIAAHAVMGVEAAQHETTAVEEHEQGKGAGAQRRVDADAQRPARPVDGPLAISAGDAIKAMRASYCARATSSDKVWVAGTSVP